MRAVVALIGVVGSSCSFNGGSGAPADAGVAIDGADGSIGSDAQGVDASCNPFSFTPSNVDPCDLPGSIGPLSVPSLVELDTDAATLGGASLGGAVLVQSDGSSVLVVVADSIVVADELTVIGSRALILVSLASVMVDGGITLIANGESSPGSDGPGCIAADDGATQDVGLAMVPAAGSGGGGGGFGSPGGLGAQVDTSNVDSSGGGISGEGLAPLSGGCSGGSGGNNGGGAGAGFGGRGGGAVQVVAVGEIEVSGRIVAPGLRGGGASASYGGGGGGGSGGGILLEGNHVVVGGALLAQGGGGGEGARGGNGGLSGEDGHAFDVDPAAGGANGGNGGDGGDGGASVDAGDGERGNNTNFRAAGSGGGGGGLGRIRIRSVLPASLDDGVFSPPLD